MGIYKFNPDDAELFASFVGIKATRHSDELTFRKCPYCGKSTDDKNKFSINLNTGMFNCFRASCGAKGNMITLSRDFGFSLGRDVDAYYQTADYSSKSYRKFREEHRKESTDPAVQYLKSRGISEGICKKYGITTKAGEDSILVFPFRNTDGALELIKYRNMDFKKGISKGSKEYCEPGCKPILFGMDQCLSENEDKPLVITEGQIDSLSVSEAGIPNAVSVPFGCNGFTWIPYCYDFMNKYREIIVAGDCENGKITLSEELSRRWPNKVRICRSDDYKGCKDANEILQKYGSEDVRSLINNAVHIEDARIKPLARVKQVDILEIPAIGTGSKSLDELLNGGFHLGQLAVLTGKRGEGKSTLASMWGAHALRQNYKCFFYSGELVDFFFRNWMDCQVAGKGKITTSDADKLSAWYGDRIFIYDNTVLDMDESETESLVDTVEKAIVRYNCQFIVLDNLMTALNVDLNNDLYRAQSDFVGKLARLAKKYNVMIVLVSHPRKTYGTLTNDDVAGSSNITDKADIVITFSRKEPTIVTNAEGKKETVGSDEYQRVIEVTKNRLTGKLGKVDVFFDYTGSRRLYETSEDLHIDFGWNSFTDSEDNQVEFYDAMDDDYIPF